MKRFLILSSLCFTLYTLAQPTSFCGKIDILKLKAIADKNFNNQDAVILHEGKSVTLLPDGRRQVQRHRIVWIGTGQGIRSYADLRIPFDSKRTTFKLLALRTWRDGQWWDSTDTSSVETLPYSVAHADEYTHIREMMLLQNGVELPCTMEVAWIIEDIEPFRGGVEGLWIFPQHDPVISSTFILNTPKDMRPHIYQSSDVGPPEKISGQDHNTFIWRMGPMNGYLLPETEEQASYSPCLTYSSFKTWKHLGETFLTRFKGAQSLDISEHMIKSIGENEMQLHAGLPSKLKQDILEITHNHDIGLSQARKIVAYADKHTRLIGNVANFTYSIPREAFRTYFTGYAHSLDRTVLTASLLEQAGFKVRPFFLARQKLDLTVPTFAQFDGPGLMISGKSVDHAYLPSNGTHLESGSSFSNSTMWFPDEEQPVFRPVLQEVSKLSVSLEMKICSKEKQWKGTGVVSSTGALCLYSRMQGLNNQAGEHLNTIVSEIIPDAELKHFSPVTFNEHEVVAGFKIKVDIGKKDKLNRITLVIGEPAYGLFDALPYDVELGVEHRQTPVYFSGPLEQEIKICFIPGDEQQWVYIPKELKLENSVGVFHLKVVEKENIITLIRSLKLKKSVVRGEEWKELRALLLADRHEQNRTLLLK